MDDRTLVFLALREHGLGAALGAFERLVQRFDEDLDSAQSTIDQISEDLESARATIARLQEEKAKRRSAGPWIQEPHPRGGWHRMGDTTALAWVWFNPSVQEWEWARLPAGVSGREATVEAAKAAADAVLVAEGWVL